MPYEDHVAFTLLVLLLLTSRHEVLPLLTIFLYFVFNFVVCRVPFLCSFT